MREAYWAAREGDVLLHTSIMADFAGGFVEFKCYEALATVCVVAVAVTIAVIAGGGLEAAAIAVIAALIGTADILTSILGLIVSVGASLALKDYISEAADWVCSLFPQSEYANIDTGSKNTRINSKPSARAAGIVKKAETAQAPQQTESFIDITGNILQLIRQASNEIVTPIVASPDPSTTITRIDDKIICKKHPPSSSDEFMAEGSKKVYINNQPAVRSNDRSTCEAKVTDDYKGGIKVSNNVRIGGES
ncbi:PAAR domain-containing protein, partial [Snodgrassella sp. M0118]